MLGLFLKVPGPVTLADAGLDTRVTMNVDSMSPPEDESVTMNVDSMSPPEDESVTMNVDSTSPPEDESVSLAVDSHASQEEDKSAEVKSKIILKANLWILRFI